MHIFLRNGGIVHVMEARLYSIIDKASGAVIELKARSRGRVLAEFRLAEVAGWCYDNVELVHYHLGEKATQFMDPL